MVLWETFAHWETWLRFASDNLELARCNVLPPASVESRSMARTWKLMAALLCFAVVACAKVEKDVSKLQIGVKVWTHRRDKSSSLPVDVHSIRRRRPATPIPPQHAIRPIFPSWIGQTSGFGWVGGQIFVPT